MHKLIHLKDQPFGNGTYDFTLTPGDIAKLEYGQQGRALLIDGQMQFLPRSTARPIYEIFGDIMSGRIETENGTLGNPFGSRANERDICAIVALGLVSGGSGTVDGVAVEVDNYAAYDLMKAYGPPAHGRRYGAD